MLNLFHLAADPNIVCALRDGAALPAFLREPTWCYGGKRDHLADGPTARIDQAAEEVMARQFGYYIFTRD